MDGCKLVAHVKAAWWRIPIEIREWEWALLSIIPGHVGEFLRRLILSRQFKICGKNLKIATQVRIRNPNLLEVGDAVVIAEDTFINAGGGLEIGNNVILGPYSKIWTVNHNFERLDLPIWEQGWTRHFTRIEDGVWIGAGAIVLPGVTIAKGSIIGAGTVVTKNVPSCSIVVGNPGRVVGSRLKGKMHYEQT